VGPFNILVTASRACQALEIYREALEPEGCRLVVHPPAIERHSDEQLLPLICGIDGIICGDDRITERVFEAAPRLRVVAKWGTGIDGIDLEAAKRRGVVVCNTPGAFSEPVADSVLAYLLLFTRRPDTMAHDMREGRWTHLPLVSLRERTLGLVGFGDIARAVARRASAFGMSVLACDVRAVEADAAELGVEMVLLDELLSRSDFVSLHADLRPENRRLINASRLGLMRPTAVLVNTARGGLVDEPALVAALSQRRLGGAALDVFEDEPLPLHSPLRALPGVYLAPHNSNSSPLAAQRVHANTIRGVLDALRPVTP
jgi:D-3-phosphoglycerate dehydrogenase / 2-oxoglutarate reductase